jgi:hypothetical protein
MWIGFCKQKSYNPRTGNDADADDEFVDDNNIGLTTSQYFFINSSYHSSLQLLLLFLL